MKLHYRYELLFYNLYQNKVVAKSTKASTELVAGLILNDYKTIESVSNIKDYRNNEKSKIGAVEIANLQISLRDIDKKNYIGAVEKLVTIEKNKDYNEVTRYFARYLICSIIIDKSNELKANNIFEGKDDWGNLDKKIEEYFDYFNSDSKPFFASALTLKSIWLHKNGNIKDAKDCLELIINSKTSKMLKLNAKQILSNLETEEKKVNKINKN